MPLRSVVIVNPASMTSKAGVQCMTCGIVYETPARFAIEWVRSEHRCGGTSEVPRQKRRRT